jgi:murein DD-endopeptidase MepM/ murein hydrolase activator NlpD
MFARPIAVIPLLAVALCGDGPRTPVRNRAPLASACGDSTRVSWDPATPRQGTLFRIRVSGVPAGTQLTGRAGSEPLHFTTDSANPTFAESFAAVPIDVRDSLGVEVRCTAGERADTRALWVVPASGEYPVERLRVAPGFARAPDSALAARIRRESERAAEVAAGSHETPRLWTESFLRPRASRVTSGFGRGREFNGTITSRHMGTDFAGAVGAPVRAANRGVVRIVDAFYYGGNVVYIDHGRGLTSAYLHLSRQRVAAGDTVERGQVIGAVGATGRVTGPHLHLIVRYGNVTVDPLSLYAIAGDSTSRPSPESNTSSRANPRP